MELQHLKRSGWILLVLMVAALVVGCRHDLPDALEITEDPAEDVLGGADDFSAGSVDARPLRVYLDEVPVLSGEPKWEASFSCRSSLTFSIGHTDGAVAVSKRIHDGRYAVRLIDAFGEEVWSRFSPERGFVSGRVEVLQGPDLMVGAAMYNTTGSGVLRVWDREGQLQFERPLSGVTCFQRSPEGGMLALLNRYDGDLTFVDADSGRSLGSTDVGSETVVEFVGGTDLMLVHTWDEIRLIDRGADTLWSQSLMFDLRGDVIIADQGQRIALTTVDPDNTLYVFDRAGQLDWKYMLFPGGHNSLILGDDSRLLVYNVGVDSGIFLMDMDSGEPLWRYFIRPSDGSATVRIEDAAVGEDGMVTAHMVLLGESDDRVEESHQLVFFCPQGDIVGRMRLGINVQVDLASSGNAVVVASASRHSEAGVRVVDTLTYYDLSNAPAPLSASILELR